MKALPILTFLRDWLRAFKGSEEILLMPRFLCLEHSEYKRGGGEGGGGGGGTRHLIF